MAKKAVINREQKRRELVAKFAARRALLLTTISNVKLNEEERAAARLKLQALPRDSSPTRQRRRCAITGRSRGVYRKFGLGRTKIREVAARGEIPGLAKASW